MALTAPEKRFIKRALDQGNAPLLFVASHIWTCRKLNVDPDMHELQAVADEVQNFIMEDK